MFHVSTVNLCTPAPLPSRAEEGLAIEVVAVAAPSGLHSLGPDEIPQTERKTVDAPLIGEENSEVGIIHITLL
jgi:hypothetical protein